MEGKFLADQIRTLSKKYGKILTLNEIIACKKRGEITISKDFSLDNYVFVHADNYEPDNNCIETVVTKLNRGKEVELGDHCGINTTHFAVNGQVEEHGSGDSWDKFKYASVVLGKDFVDRFNDRIGSYRVEDSFIRGSADITNGFVLCKKMEDAKRIQNMNPGIVAIPDDDYPGDRKGPERVGTFLSEVLEIEPRIPSAVGWFITAEKMLTDELYLRSNNITLSRNGSRSPNEIDREAEEEYYANLESYLGKRVMRQQHANTLEYSEGHFRSSLIKYKRQVTKEFDFAFDHYVGAYRKNLSELDYGITEDYIKFHTEMFNQELSEVGLSDWSFFDDRDSAVKSMPKRIKESEAVDDFLGINAKEIYDGDMISTNIKRIEMIGDRNPALKEALFRHIVYDYKIMEAHYMDRVDTKDMDFKTYSESVKSRLSKLGLEKAFEEQFMSIEEKAAEQKKQQEKIEDGREEALLESYGYKIHDTSDPVLRDISKLRAIASIKLQMMIQDIREGNVDEYGRPNFSGKDWNVTIKMGKSVLNRMPEHLKEETNPERLDEPLSFLGLRGEDLFRKDENGNIIPTFRKYQEKADELLDSQERTAIEIVEKERSGKTVETRLEESLTGLYQTSRLVPEELEAEQANIKSDLSAEKGIEVENDNDNEKNEIQ